MIPMRDWAKRLRLYCGSTIYSNWSTSTLFRHQGGPEPPCRTGELQEGQRSGWQDRKSGTCQNCTLATRFEVKGWTRVRGRTEGGDTVPGKNLKLRGDLVAAAAIAQLRRLWAGVDTGRPLEQTINRYAEPGHPGWAKNTKGNKYKHKNEIPRQLDHNWKRSGPLEESIWPPCHIYRAQPLIDLSKQNVLKS